MTVTVELAGRLVVGGWRSSSPTAFWAASKPDSNSCGIGSSTDPDLRR